MSYGTAPYRSGTAPYRKRRMDGGEMKTVDEIKAEVARMESAVGDLLKLRSIVPEWMGERILALKWVLGDAAEEEEVRIAERMRRLQIQQKAEQLSMLESNINYLLRLQSTPENRQLLIELRNLIKAEEKNARSDGTFA